MCLVIKDSNVVQLIAEEDIICYKRVKRYVNPLEFEKKYLNKYFVGKIFGRFIEGKVTAVDGNFFKFFLDNWYDVNSITEFKDLELNFTYLTPYRNFEIEIGKEYKGKLDEPYREIEIGFHSYQNLHKCKFDQLVNEVTVECIIPKGSKYYIGYFGISVSYASDTIRYVKLV